MVAVGLVLASARKDLRRRLREPLSLLLWLAIPAVIGGLMSSLSGGDEGPRPKARILLVDRDESLLTQFLAGAGEREESPFAFELVNLAAGRERIDAGDASALLVIPDGFTEAVLRERPCELELVTNPAQRILPGMVEEALAILSEATFYLHRVFGDELRELVADSTDGEAAAEFWEDARVADLAAGINRRFRDLDAYLFPPAIGFEAALLPAGADAAPALGFGELFFPGLLFMMLFWLAQGMSADLWQERAAGTLRRAVTTPERTGPLLLGKLLATATITAGLTLAAALLGAVAFDLRLTTMGPGLVWAVACGVVLTLAMYLVQLLATSQRAGNLLGNLIVFPLLMVGGSFFPFQFMPDGMAAIGRRTPNGWALVQLQALLAGRLGGRELAVAAAALAAAGVLLYAIVSRRLRRRFAPGV